jgi:hypothetical protein
MAHRSGRASFIWSTRLIPVSSELRNTENPHRPGPRPMIIVTEHRIGNRLWVWGGELPGFQTCSPEEPHLSHRNSRIGTYRDRHPPCDQASLEMSSTRHVRTV